jgi:hypothetical protein
MGRKSRCLLAGVAALALFAGCTDTRRYDQAICVLIDVSGTYADQKTEAVRILKREVLPALEPGDTILVIRIDSESYEKDNLVALVTLDARPSKANAQKLALSRKLEAFAKSDLRSVHTDIPGAMMLGAEYLTELQSASRILLVFSDMAEDLPAGATRRLSDSEFQDIRVVAMNVKHLSGDTGDPQVFRDRMASWEKRVTSAGAMGWQTIMDSSRLPALLASIR